MQLTLSVLDLGIRVLSILHYSLAELWILEKIYLWEDFCIQLGGGFVTGKDFIEASTARHRLSLEETLYSAVILTPTLPADGIEHPN